MISLFSSQNHSLLERISASSSWTRFKNLTSSLWNRIEVGWLCSASLIDPKSRMPSALSPSFRSSSPFVPVSRALSASPPLAPELDEAEAHVPTCTTPRSTGGRRNILMRSERAAHSSFFSFSAFCADDVVDTGTFSLSLSSEPDTLLLLSLPSAPSSVAAPLAGLAAAVAGAVSIFSHKTVVPLEVRLLATCCACRGCPGRSLLSGILIGSGITSASNSNLARSFLLEPNGGERIGANGGDDAAMCSHIVADEEDEDQLSFPGFTTSASPSPSTAGSLLGFSSGVAVTFSSGVACCDATPPPLLLVTSVLALVSRAVPSDCDVASPLLPPATLAEFQLELAAVVDSWSASWSPCSSTSCSVISPRSSTLPLIPASADFFDGDLPFPASSTDFFDGDASQASSYTDPVSPSFFACEVSLAASGRSVSVPAFDELDDAFSFCSFSSVFDEEEEAAFALSLDSLDSLEDKAAAARTQASQSLTHFHAAFSTHRALSSSHRHAYRIG